jgi:hypothetical protein
MTKPQCTPILGQGERAAESIAKILLAERRQGLARLIEGPDFRRKIEAIAKPPDSLVEVVILGAPQIFA